MPAAPPYATGGAAVARRGIPKAAVAVGLALIVVAAIVAAGLLTNWFGLANSPVYVMTKQTQYTVSGEKNFVLKRELDDRGSIVKQESKSYIDGTQTYTSSTEYENDQNGFPERSTTTSKPQNGNENKSTTKFENEFDNQGRPVQIKAKSDSQTSTVSYEYYGNGNVKASKQEIEMGAPGGSAPQNCLSSEYDEHGYMASRTVESGFDDSDTAGTEYEFEWAFGSSNVPTGYEASARSFDGSKTHDAGSTDYTVETDDHGNITAIYDEDDNLLAEYEYELVNNPSPAARLSASMKPQVVNVASGA